MRRLNLSMVKFMEYWWQTDNEAVAQVRGKLFRTQEPALHHLLTSIMLRPTQRAEAAVTRWILEKAIEICRSEFSGRATHFLSSQTVELADLSADAQRLDDERARAHASFTYSLLHGVLRRDTELQDDDSSSEAVSDEEDVVLPACETSIDATTTAESSEQRPAARTLATDILHCIGYYKNRRSNFRACINGLTIYFGGVTDRVQSWFYDRRASVSRDHTLDSLLTLATANMARLRERIADPSCVFSRTLDNLALSSRTQTTQTGVPSAAVQQTTAAFVTIDDGAPRDALSVDLYRQHVSTRPPLAFDFVPEALLVRSIASRPKVVKASLARALHSLKPSLQIPLDRRQPPVVDCTFRGRNDVQPLELMGVGDTSQVEYSLMLEELRKQLGQSREDEAGRIAVTYCDAANHNHLHGLQRLRPQPIDPADGLTHHIAVLGVQHFIWVLAGALFRVYIGDKSTPGSLASIASLIGSRCRNWSASTKIKDFDALVGLLRASTTLLLVDILLAVMNKDRVDQVSDDDLRDDNFDALLDLTYEKYFSDAALADAAERGDTTRLTALHRVRDLVLFEETVLSVAASDVGRFENVLPDAIELLWGIPGVRQYRYHVPRLLLMLNGDLPPSLTMFIRRNLFISTTARPGHSVPQDLSMELLNYRLAYFFGSRRGAQSFDHLARRISPNISLAHDLLSEMDARYGRSSFARSGGRIGLSTTSANTALQSFHDAGIHTTTSTDAEATRADLEQLDPRTRGREQLWRHWKQRGGFEQFRSSTPATDVDHEAGELENFNDPLTGRWQDADDYDDATV